MNEEIIGIEVSGEIYPIKDEETSGKTQTLETKVSTVEEKITNLEAASTEHGEKIAQIEANIGETDIQELKSLVDAHDEELKELTEMIDDTTISDKKTWSSEKINDALEDLGSLIDATYTTKEKVIGKWIDGKPLYRKVIDGLDVNITNKWMEIANIENVNIVIKLVAWGKYTSNNASLIIHPCAIVESNAIKANSLNLNTVVNKVIIEYTKTTD